MDLAQLGAAIRPLRPDVRRHRVQPARAGRRPALAKNGVLVLASVTSGDATAELPTDLLNQRIVLGNQVIVGTVNAHRDDFVAGVEDMLRAEATHPGWLGALLTTRIDGLTGYAEMLDRLEHDHEAIKVYVEIGADEPKADA